MYQKKPDLYDAIVVGTGISGGWAAKELTEKGLKTLVLERGRMVRHIVDYPTMNKRPWELPYGNRLTASEREEYPVQLRTGYTVRQDTKHWWLRDADQPYEEINRFDWIRGYHVGGRSIMWGRHCYRFSDIDFEANARDGIAVDWPIRYRDIQPWYDYVQEYIGVQGEPLGLPQLPDGPLLPPMGLTCVEQDLREKLAGKYPDRILTIGRTANLSRSHHGRSACAYRNLCSRGCPYTAYFSSNGVTLPAAEATGNMTLRPHSIVNQILYDDDTGRATGVEVIDAETQERTEYSAKVIFLCASTVNSTLIMMNSRSRRFPDGFGNDSGELGRNLMDHHFQVGANANVDGFEDVYYKGRRPTGFLIPRYRNVGQDRRNYLRGFHYQGGSSRRNWWRGIREMSIGKELKDLLRNPGNWTIGLTAFGEMLPHPGNKMYLNHDKRDKWGQPAVVFDCRFRENEWAMRGDMANDAAEMLELAGYKDVRTYDDPGGPGLGIHEMGTARMGRDAKTSVLNKWNQVHACKNVFVTDGSCMTSAANQNPSLTYMALTARAVHYATDQLKKGAL